jgi:alkylated DNA repair dioxygenase AlkB
MATQLSLFDTGDHACLRPLDGCVDHVDLGEGAWLDVRRQWVARHDLVFDRLRETVAWRSERRRMYDRTVAVPRLVAFYDEDDELPDALLAEARERLSDNYQDQASGPLVTAGLCLYRDGADSVAWHGDTIGRDSGEDTLVAIVSLGERRRFLLRRAGRGPAIRYDLGAGDLLVMGGSCQRTWQHAVPKGSRVHGPRISVQFRSAGRSGSATVPTRDEQPRRAAGGSEEDE